MVVPNRRTGILNRILFQFLERPLIAMSEMVKSWTIWTVYR